MPDHEQTSEVRSLVVTDLELAALLAEHAVVDENFDDGASAVVNSPHCDEPQSLALEGFVDVLVDREPLQKAGLEK